MTKSHKELDALLRGYGEEREINQDQAAERQFLARLNQISDHAQELDRRDEAISEGLSWNISSIFAGLSGAFKPGFLAAEAFAFFLLVSGYFVGGALDLSGDEYWLNDQDLLAAYAIGDDADDYSFDPDLIFDEEVS